MTEAELKDRFNRFAIGVYKLTTRFPNLPVYQNINFQLLKSSSSSAANYHAACRAKSKADFINKLKIVEEELDESIFWMNYLVSIDKQWADETEPLLKEGDELLSIIVASINTAKGNQKTSRYPKSNIRNQ
jgi:four helix bundle protein